MNKPKYVKRECEKCGAVYAVLQQQADKTRHCPAGKPRKEVADEDVSR